MEINHLVNAPSMAFSFRVCDRYHACMALSLPGCIRLFHLGFIASEYQASGVNTKIEMLKSTKEAIL